MNRRWLRIAVLVWLGWWFGIFVPGHQRGRISLSGEVANCDPAASSAVSDSCCAHPRGGGPGSPADPAAPLKGGPGNCLVCYIVASLDTPTAIVLVLPASEPLVELSRPAPTPLHTALSLWPPLLGRAPPRSFTPV